MSGTTFSSPNALFDPGSAVAQQSSLFGTAAPLNVAPGLGTPTNQLAPVGTAAPAADPAAPPASPQTALDAVNAWAAKMNQNAYGFDPTTNAGQQQLGILGSAGFPLWNDSRMIQDQLAQWATPGATLPQGITQQMALDEFHRQLAMASGGGYGGGTGGGNTGQSSAASTSGIV